MPALNLYTSNKMEQLIEKLNECCAQPLASVLTPEVVVVQSRGMERWINLQLAQKRGITANILFPFLDRFVTDLFETVPRENRCFGPDILTWIIHSIIPGCLDLPEFSMVRHHCENDPSGLKLYQLSSKLADLFDAYTVHRPEMIMRWETEVPDSRDDEAWQALLWKRIVSRYGSNHRVKLRDGFFVRAKNSKSEGLLPNLRGIVPARVNFFGISYFPRFHIDVILALSECIDVNLFVLDPCGEFWDDISSTKEQSRIRRRKQIPGEAFVQQHHDTGNDLLATMGMNGRNFLAQIHSFDVYSEDCAMEPDTTSLLGNIQADFFWLRDHKQTPKVIGPSDKSVAVHVCHSPMRELEVLHDHLLAMMDSDKALNPRDIIVMTPDIATYAPCIHAVFGATQNEHTAIPYTIADQTARHLSSIIDAVLSVFTLVKKRFSASIVLAFLETPAVLRRFDIDPASLPLIRSWIDQAHIRWGEDGVFKNGLGLPPTVENTWDTGLHRLLLAYALPEGESSAIAGISPCGSIEGEQASVLGNVNNALQAIFTSAHECTVGHTLRQWPVAVHTMLTKLFLLDDSEEQQMAPLYSALSVLGEAGTIVDTSQVVTAEALLEHLGPTIDAQPMHSTFMRQGVTFCSMMPMRSIPSKVICIIGLNFESFPRMVHSPSFDLIAAHPRPGDRSVRNEDRYLFLEAIISARKTFYVSYIGRSLQDNSIIPPSVVVSELLDYIKQSYVLANGDIHEHLVVEHRLQPFCDVYFKTDNPQMRYFSFSEENCLGLKGPQQCGQIVKFIHAPLDQNPENIAVVSLDDVRSFFTNPARFFCTQSLGINLTDRILAIEDSEPFSLDPLDTFILGQKLLQPENSNGADAVTYERFADSLPHGQLGKTVFAMHHHQTAQLFKKVAPYIAKGTHMVDIDCTIGDISLNGMVKVSMEGAVVQYRFANIRAHDRLGLWITINALACSNKQQSTVKGIVAGKDGVEVMHSASRPDAVVRQLLECFRKGQTMPLPFFVLSSWTYAESLISGKKTHEQALYKAQQKYTGSTGNFGQNECDDPYIKKCFGESYVLGDEFVKMAQGVWGPCIECSEKTDM